MERQGDYRFRADYDGTQFWSGEVNHCMLPGCEVATVEVTLPVVVTVLDTDAVPQVGLAVYVFDDTAYTGFNDTTDGTGEVSFTLPQGDYRFRSDLNGTKFWSDSVNHCTIPGCETASIDVTIPVTVTVQSQTGSPYPDLPVYVFSGESYTGYNGISDTNGQVIFILPTGDYRFRSDYDGVQFWSDEVDHCTIPGCLEAIVEIPGGTGEVNVTIDYTYDPLYRLTGADYSTGEYFWYTYDAVGNRLTQETHEDLNTYVYDDANRLVEVDGTTFIWDDNGNLIQDDVRIYNYDHTNRLRFVLMDGDTFNFEYNGLGDRLRQIVNGETTNYSLDLNLAFTQVVEDGTNAYLYGFGRIGEASSTGWEYYQVDGQDSIRQFIDSAGVVLASQSFEPYGSMLSLEGSEISNYGYVGEWSDGTDLLNLRARYYAPSQGRFISRDYWGGDQSLPLSFNKFTYALNNPVLLLDPSGECPICWIAIAMGIFLSGCAFDNTEYEDVLNSTVGLLVYEDYQGEEGAVSLATFTSTGELLTHDHFIYEGYPLPSDAARVIILDRNGRVLHDTTGDNIQRGVSSGIQGDYAFYKVDNIDLRSKGVIGASLGSAFTANPGALVTIPRWKNGVPFTYQDDVPLFGQIEAVSGRVEHFIGFGNNPRVFINSVTVIGDSGGGLWSNGLVFGVTRSGSPDGTTVDLIR